MTMTKLEREKLLPGVLGILRKVAWSYSKRTGVEFEDLMAEAYFGFMQACDKFDPKKHAKFSTWCQTKVTCHIKTVLAKQYTDASRLSFVEEIKDEMLPVVLPDSSAFRSCLEEQLKDLSRDAKDLIRAILDQTGPDRTPLQMLKEGCRRLRFERGFDEVELAITVNEIKAAFGN